jgi:hypothetical protein
MGSTREPLIFSKVVLSPAARKVLSQIGPYLEDRHFYLGGGTALALYLGHRKSKDFDWFRKDPIKDPLRFGKDMQDTGIPIRFVQLDKGTLEGTVSRIRVSLIEYRYPLLQAVSHWTEMGMSIASIPDLAAMKLSAITQRGSKKDFIDILALSRIGMDLSAMLSAYQTKFKTREIGHVLYSLTYFDDADQERPPVMIWSLDWKTVKRTVKVWVNEWYEKSSKTSR